ncbi:hypothetical protein BDF21DRAFT_69352 [Thamnidium elegans]|nr:hypothetical protein BDF21DRAFT_69352 [Thamnidium elegans]
MYKYSYLHHSFVPNTLCVSYTFLFYFMHINSIKFAYTSCPGSFGVTWQYMLYLFFLQRFSCCHKCYTTACVINIWLEHTLKPTWRRISGYSRDRIFFLCKKSKKLLYL